MDKLDEIFEMQKQFAVKILGPDALEKVQKSQQEWILKYTQAMQQEIAELIDCVPWKWWAHYQKLDTEHAKIELVDILCFVISIAHTLGMSSEDLFDKYRRKNEINLKRQNDGYTDKTHDDYDI